MYSPSSCATLTPQGIAIKGAAVRFGNGETLPFSPCKRGYIPVVEGEHMYACHIHHKFRKKRVSADGGIFRKGEKDLSDFWCLSSETKASTQSSNDGNNTNSAEGGSKKAKLYKAT